MSEEERETIAKLLKGRTMSVYALLLREGKMGARDIARKLGFSSHSLAIHHLTKLVELRLIEKNSHGEYLIVKTVRVGSLSLFVSMGRWLLPRLLFLIVLFSVILISYVALLMSVPLDQKDTIFILLCVSSILVLLYEARKVWRLEPF